MIKLKIKLSQLRQIIKEESRALHLNVGNPTSRLRERSGRLLEGIREVLSTVNCEPLTISLSEFAALIKRIDSAHNLTENIEPGAAVEIYRNVMLLKKSLSLGVEYDSVRSIVNVAYRLLKQHMSDEPWAAKPIKLLGNLLLNIEDFAKNVLPELVSHVDAVTGDAYRQRQKKNQEIKAQQRAKMAAKEDFGHVPKSPSNAESKNDKWDTDLPTGKASPGAIRNT